MRKRRPGFYVSVVSDQGMGAGPVELLDGPWDSPEAAANRAGNIKASRPGDGPAPVIVKVESDGVTVVRDLGGRP